jgi:hypothetical protein
MKTYKNLMLEIEDRKKIPLEESWKSATAIALIMRIRSIQTKITNIKHKPDDADETMKLLFMKLDLLSQQNNNLSYLIFQQGNK